MHYCIRECPAKSWYLDTMQQKCMRCHSSCTKCIGPTSNDCITCSNSHVLDGFSCRLQCPKGLFKNLKTRQCQKCHPTCGSCSAPGPLSCTSCVHDLKLHRNNSPAGKCISICKPGQYKSKLSKCLPCHSSCKTCYGPTSTSCLGCISGHVYFQNTCQKNCPTGTFFKHTLQRCFQCHPLCKTCIGSSPNKCSSCISTLFLQDSTCVIQCSSKSTLDLKNRICQPCEDCRAKPGKPKNRSVQDPTLQTLKFHQLIQFRPRSQTDGHGPIDVLNGNDRGAVLLPIFIILVLNRPTVDCQERLKHLIKVGLRIINKQLNRAEYFLLNGG